jgi:hypothetical protein
MLSACSQTKCCNARVEIFATGNYLAALAAAAETSTAAAAAARDRVQNVKKKMNAGARVGGSGGCHRRDRLIL